MATATERLGVRVERLVVDLGRTLSWLVRRLLTSVGGPAGWALFAAELITLLDDLLALEQIVDWPATSATPSTSCSTSDWPSGPV